MKIPKLIPMYNLHRLPEIPTPTGISPAPPVRSTRGPQRMGPVPPYFQRGQVPARGTSPLPSRGHPGSTHAQLHPPRQPIAYQQQSPSRAPISRLPPTLTEAQLAVMDTVTREAIDERLRVLEGVSGAMCRCIEDLMRVRSSLPTSVTPTTTPVTPATHSSTSTPSPSIPGVVGQPSVASATETLDKAISTAREAAESGSKVEESLRTDLPQAAIAGPSSAQAGETPSLTPPSKS
jgi:E3 ubiquitin-protein ligase synoviolin